MTKDFSRLPHVPRTSQSFTGQTPVHFEGHPGGPFEGDGRWVGVKDFEHSTLCRALNLDPVRFYFDMPSSVRGTGSSSLGSGGQGGKRTVEGFVFMAGRDRPVATLYVCRDSDKLRDINPLDAREYEAFGYRR